MTDVRIYLTEGFSDDRVVISVDGAKVFEKNSVTTKKLYGLAEELTPVSVAGQATKITVDLPEKGLSSTFSVDLRSGANVPITIQDGTLNHAVVKKIGFL
ncbi:hypothetical protein HA461_25830 (plasmid) [Rhizobium leguminosarum bv. trifolii]|uniref:hypothetical protein n=1 Tax=Rhizobium leguminosarum TaxID=384 RepID=UPI00140FEEF5|nr:hypothetical protein [Rhizobium leguminosarum]QIO54611.1 hypothetical protein HA461_25830 [Rhizobium leguminosarum bv. trifolii]